MGSLKSSQDIVTVRTRAPALKQEHDNSNHCRTMVAACAIRPAPSNISRNYEDNTAIKKVYIGTDYYWLFTPLLGGREDEGHARKRLLDSIECPDYQIVEEGRGQDTSVGSSSSYNVVTKQNDIAVHTDYHPYLWVRYRCKQ